MGNYHLSLMDAVQDSKTKKENKEEKVQEVLAIDDQPEYQEKIMFLCSTVISCTLTGWCILVLSLGYVKLPTRLFGIDIPPDQPRIDTTFAAGLLGNLLSSTFGISVGGNKKKKKEGEGSGAIPTGNGYQTIIVKQPLELIAKPAEVQRVDPITNRPIGPDGKLK